MNKDVCDTLIEKYPNDAGKIAQMQYCSQLGLTCALLNTVRVKVIWIQAPSLWAWYLGRKVICSRRCHRWIGRELLISYKLFIVTLQLVTIPLSVAILPQFTMQILTEGSEPQIGEEVVWGKRLYRWIGRWLSAYRLCSNHSAICNDLAAICNANFDGVSIPNSFPQIYPSRGGPGSLSNTMLLETTQVSMPNGISFRLAALAGCTSVTDILTDRQTDRRSTLRDHLSE